MKRALTVLPFLALLFGLALFLFRRDGALSSPPRTANPPPPVGAPPVPNAPHAHTHGPAVPPPASKDPGTIRFVVTMRGQPAAGVPILVNQAGTGQHMNFTTEADGTQLLRGLPPGEYAYEIRHEDAIPVTGNVFVQPGGTAVVPADLKPGARVHGTVTNASGQPVPDTRIFLLDERTKYPVNDAVAVSDKNGHYALKQVPPGAFGVRYRHAEYKPHDRLGLVFRNGSDEYRIDVVLQSGARISGRVVDEQDVPIEGAELLASTGDSANLAKSAADGSFSVTGLNDAPANISAQKKGYGKAVLRNLSGNPTNVVFRLPRAGTVLGRLEMDIIPRQLQVTLSRYDDELRQVIPADSRFFAALEKDKAFAIADLAPGTYWIEIAVEGYEAVDRPQVVVASGKTTPPVVISMRKKN